MAQYFNNIMLLLLLLFGFSTSYAQVDQDIQAKIRIAQSDNLISIYATAINNTNTYQVELNYALLTLKESKSGNLSKNTQSGPFSLKPEEEKTLSRQSINLDPESKISIFLFIRKEDTLLSKDTLVLGNIQKKYTSTSIREKEIVLSGLIIDNVLTKPGKDFYDYFSQFYRTNGLSFPFVIVIEEKPNLGGRNSQIDIKIKDEIVFQFVTQPKEEFLQKAAKQANIAVYKYNLKRNKLYSDEKLY